MSLCFDITQFTRMPMASGIQRVLLQIAERCADDDRFAVMCRDGAHLLTPDAADMLIRSRFDSTWRGPLWWSATDVALGRLTTDEIGDRFDAYVFAELTYDRETLDRWQELIDVHPDRVGAIFYDATPETHRELFGVQPPAGAGRYFRMVATLDRVACISHGARRELAQIARRDETEFDVAPLGGDHLPVADAGDPPTSFVVLGDLKAKKRVDIVLEAFERVRDEVDVDLVIIGRSIEGEDRIAGLVRSASAGPRVTWLSEATDADVSEQLGRAVAGAFVAGEEGFGLPALELLHAGVPIVVDATLPSLRYVDDHGQIRLEHVDVASVAEAIVRLVGAERDRFRGDAENVAVPSWDTFMTSIREVMTR